MPITNYLPSSRLIQPGVCTSTTRPASPFEGQTIYETDTDMMAIWNGSAWRYIAATTPTNGTVLQVGSTTKIDTFTTSSTTWTDVTGLSVSITPKSNTSKVLILATLSATGETSATGFFARLMRDTTAIAIPDAAGSRIRATSVARDAQQMQTVAMHHLDSPATTSSVTYKVQIQTQGSGSVYINRITTDTDASTNARAVSSFTVMEIAG